jgi:hypothetical protein
VETKCLVDNIKPGMMDDSLRTMLAQVALLAYRVHASEGEGIMVSSEDMLKRLHTT